MIPNDALSLFPKDLNYRFVDEIISISENEVVACYTYPKDADYYKGHFENFPVTPGTILTETLIQCGAAALGKKLIYNNGKDVKTHNIVVIKSQLRFIRMVMPEERVIVRTELLSIKEGIGVFRVRSQMETEEGTLICKGSFTCKILADEQIIQP